MTGPALGTGLIALPADFETLDLKWVTLVLDTLVAHPQWFSVPGDPQRLREAAASVLADRRNLHWGVWNQQDLVGALSLTEVQPGLDAQVHFLFLDRNLVGKRTLLQHFLLYCFSTLGLRRLSATVPEDADKLLRFYRKLGFRYEGEHRATGLTPTAFLEAGAPGLRPIENAPSWIAKHGSRREGVFWREDRWIDVLRLRLMRSEWESGHADQQQPVARR